MAASLPGDTNKQHSQDRLLDDADRRVPMRHQKNLRFGQLYGQYPNSPCLHTTGQRLVEAVEVDRPASEIPETGQDSL